MQKGEIILRPLTNLAKGMTRAEEIAVKPKEMLEAGVEYYDIFKEKSFNLERSC